MADDEGITIAVINSSIDTATSDKKHNKSTGGATHTMDGFKPSQDLPSDLTMDGTAQVVTLATSVKLGAGRITIFNQGVTTESIRFAFGTSSANAQANLTIAAAAATTGLLIPAFADFGELCFQLIGVPALATHVAIANNAAADTQAVQVVQGV